MSSTLSKGRVAFLGLGLMGGGMARRLLDAGYPLTVYNRTAAKAEVLRLAGARVALSPRAAAADATVVISMVADDAAARSCWLGADGALADAVPGTLLIESSTVSVEWIHELAAAATAKACELIDAPVTGTKPHAAAGELSFMVGGSAEAVTRAEPILAIMGKSIVHLGPRGSGTRLKLINNFLCGVQSASLAEAMAMIENGDLDRSNALAILGGGAPGSPLIKTLSARMTKRDYDPNFLLRLMAKDLKYAAHEGEALGVEMRTAGAALAVFERAIAAGLGEKDLSAIVEPLREKSKSGS
jgi:3-hydroxyisobutyrate dehydrogenase